MNPVFPSVAPPADGSTNGTLAEFCIRIRTARLGIGLTQLQLARELGVNRTTVVRWETGILAPTPRHRSRLAERLGGHPTDYERGIR